METLAHHGLLNFAPSLQALGTVKVTLQPDAALLAIRTGKGATSRLMQRSNLRISRRAKARDGIDDELLKLRARVGLLPNHRAIDEVLEQMVTLQASRGTLRHNDGNQLLLRID